MAGEASCQSLTVPAVIVPRRHDGRSDSAPPGAVVQACWTSCDLPERSCENEPRFSTKAATGRTSGRPRLLPRGWCVRRIARGGQWLRCGHRQAAGAPTSLLIAGRQTIQPLHETPSKTRRRVDGTPLSAGVVTALMLATFTVSIGYGVTLPLLPYLIERLLGPGTNPALISRNTGLLTSVYTLGLFLFAPVWGWLSDRYGRRRLLLVGLLGFSASMLVFSLIESVTATYLERFTSGLFAAAITPIASASIGDLAPTEAVRARRLSFVNLAGVAGFLVGPAAGIFIARAGSRMLILPEKAGAIAAPLAGASLLGLVAMIAVASALPEHVPADPLPRPLKAAPEGSIGVIAKLLTLSFVVAASISVFEVGLSLRGKQELGLSQDQIALMFTECSLVMFAVQAIVFSPWLRPEVTRWLISPALTVLAAGLYLSSRASNFGAMLTVVGAVSASAGILSPILTYWMSRKADTAQGAKLGQLTAATSLGAATGSAAGGLLFDTTALPDAAALLVTAFVVFGILMAFGLPNQLIPRNPGNIDLGSGTGNAAPRSAHEGE